VSVVSHKNRCHSSTPTNGGLRGGARSGEILSQPILGTEWGRKPKTPCGKTNQVHGTGTHAVVYQSCNSYFVRVGLLLGRI
jgi:hypothetical protein